MRTQLFTWALGVLERHSVPCSVPPTMRSGAVSPRSPAAPVASAPIARSGSRTRVMGRRRSDSSPSNTWVPVTPATSPAPSRALVPELPQSRAPSPCAASPLRPGERTRQRAVPGASSGAAGSRSQVAPSARMIPAVERTSWPSPAPEISVSPSASAAKSSARWLIDLSPGRRSSPRSRAAGLTRCDMRYFFDGLAPAAPGSLWSGVTSV